MLMNRATMVWLAETARHGHARESRYAVEVLAAMDGMPLGSGAERWLTGIASGRDAVKRRWAKAVLGRINDR